jgi:hypothetical protein
MAIVMTAAFLGTSGCVVVADDATVTCDSFDAYLASCYPSCAADWDCVYYYDGLDKYTQDLLDQCSDCLYDNSYSCADCTVGGSYCMDLLASYVGMECVY